jgi:hypothetical protein
MKLIIALGHVCTEKKTMRGADLIQQLTEIPYFMESEGPSSCSQKLSL